MPQRGYVLIFFFWALLAIITPTLVFWSASAKTSLDSYGQVRRETKARRMLDYMEKSYERNKTTIRAPVPAPAPTPLVTPARGVGEDR